jgi:thermostable 8-oxoguanine DNA glycosylase
MNLVIDPHNITNFKRTQYELEAFWLFCILTAGKTASVQSKKLTAFLANTHQMGLTPFEYIRHIEEHCDYSLDDAIRHEKLGQYTRVERAFLESLSLDLSNCTVDELESVYGVGCKTSRFFLLHTRPKQKLAVLDTHILKWLRAEGMTTAPSKTPTNTNTYKRWEMRFLRHAKYLDRDVAELDLEIWSFYNRLANG